MHQVQIHRAKQPPVMHDVVELETATPIAKAFVDQVMTAPFFDPTSYTVTIRHPRSIVTHEHPAQETRPIVVPTTDVFEELWQFSHVTISFVARVFVAALLLAYGMIELNILVMIAGLLFLPYHHQMLSVGLGVWLREWRLLGQGAGALLVSTLLIVAAGACVALLLEPPLRFQEFGTLLSGFLIALIIGIAAAFAAADDAGRRELIGLAATAHITTLPAWFGISLVFGVPDTATVVERLMAFGINVSTLIIATIAVFALLRMRGDGIRRFTKRTAGID